MMLSRSSRTADPLSDVLAALGAGTVRATRLEASGAWALAFPARARLKFVAMLRGTCAIASADAAPERFGAGDVALIGDTAYVVASDLAVPPADGEPLYADGHDVLRLGAGNETVCLGGGVAFADDGRIVLEALPPFLRIDHGAAAAERIGRVLALIEAEVGEGASGTALVTDRLSEILVVEAIRAATAAGGGDRVGWIAALADPRIGAALRLMHADVARRWTVAELAAACGMSRSAFTARFAARVGRPPLAYLTGWRMVLARRRLAAERASTAEVAAGVGYRSQSAFGHAYRRAFGHPPRASAITRPDPRAQRAPLAQEARHLA